MTPEIRYLSVTELRVVLGLFCFFYLLVFEFFHFFLVLVVNDITQSDDDQDNIQQHRVNAQVPHAKALLKPFVPYVYDLRGVTPPDLD